MNKRIENLRKKMQSNKLDAFLVTDLTNIRYLTGFSGSNGLAVVVKRSVYLITDFRYEEQVLKETNGCKIFITKNSLYEELYICKVLNKIKTIGFEGSNISFLLAQKIKKLFSFIKFLPFDDFIEDIAVQKDESEIQATRKAVEISDTVFLEALQYIQPGMTELDVAAELSYRMKKHGAECDSFDIIAASGINSSMPHVKASNKKIKNHEPLLLDFGASLAGYRSDMSRTVFFGKPSTEFLNIYETVLEAQKLAIENVRSGYSGADLDGIARDYISGRGYGKYFGHGLGHGIGLKIHLKPNLSYLSREVLAENMIITIEPGIYLPSKFGVRIEDDLVVKKNGFENLTKSPKELIIL
jgi:Xaa-Pro aminopeptidase